MPNCFLLSNRQPFLEKLSELIRSDTYYNPISIILLPQKKDENETEPTNYEHPVSLFRSIEKHFLSVPAQELHNSIVVVDELISPNLLDPLVTSSGSQQFYAMLMLAFPELLFVFLNNYGLPSKNMHFYEWLSSAKRKSLSGIYSESQLFDPNGIRTQIKKRITENHKFAPYLQVREKKAIAIEDESSYGLFLGYLAYKSFYRCNVVTSLAHLNDIKKQGSRFSLQLEDLYLNFHDRMESDKSLSILENRDSEYEFLKEAGIRNIISVGHDNEEQHSKNREYIKSLRKEGKKVEEIKKPGAGLYDLIEKGKLGEDYDKDRLNWLAKLKKGVVKTEGGNSHSSPGRLLLIAESLISRSEHILAEALDVDSAIHAAVLALEAKELLGARTPTLALHALSLQHRAEVTAECLFSGVEYILELSNRFKDIDAEVEAITNWFDPSRKEMQYINARLSLVEQLASVFKNHNQFEEELFTLSKARFLRNKLQRLKIREKANASPIMQEIKSYALKPVHSYLEYSLKSIGNFIKLLTVLILFFTLLYWILGQPCFFVTLGLDKLDCLCGSFPKISIFEALALSVKSFFMNTAPDWQNNRLNSIPLYIILFFLEAILGFANLSILVAHAYLHVIRR